MGLSDAARLALDIAARRERQRQEANEREARANACPECAEKDKRIVELERAMLEIDSATRTDGSPPPVGMPTSTLIQVRGMVKHAAELERERDDLQARLDDAVFDLRERGGA